MNLKGLDVLAPSSGSSSGVEVPRPVDNSKTPPITLNQDFFTGVSYKVVCPHCNKVRLPLRSDKAGRGILRCPICKGATVATVKEQPHTDPSTHIPSPSENIVDNSVKEPVDLGDDFHINRTYTVTCPHCKGGQLTINQSEPGPSVLVCPKCKGRIKYNARKPTEPIVKSEAIQRFRGKLILLRRGWINKDYPLKDGRNTIGRYDETKVSDIAIKGDSSMSRQSIDIQMDHHDKGYSFKLTVRNCTNPVLHNNKPLSAGDSISLNFGDSIILGRTKFRFDKDV